MNTPAQHLLVQLTAAVLICVGDHTRKGLDICDVSHNALQKGFEH